MTLKEFLFDKSGSLIRASGFYSRHSLKKDQRTSTPYKLVYFCGAKGIGYLNASLISVHRSWKQVPDLFIVTDGTPVSFISKKMIKWPGKVDIIHWEQCALYFKEQGNNDIYNYALTELWGRKFAAIHYCAAHFPSLYSDTDVLWYNSPVIGIDDAQLPVMKMSEDALQCYTASVIAALKEEYTVKSTPLNAGLMYVHGDFSNYPKWAELCRYLAENPKLGGFSEQTANAILNHHFNKNNYWTGREVLIKTNDSTSFTYTRKDHPHIQARHYASTKRSAFWRDFVYMYLGK